MDNVSIEEKYHFDTLGFLLLKEVLNQSEIKSLTSSFNSIRNNEEIDSIHLNKKEMIPDDVNHASRVFIDDHYVRINHLDKLNNNFKNLINHPKIIQYVQNFIEKPYFNFSWGISNSPGDYFSSWHSGHKPFEYSFKNEKIYSPSVNVAFFISNNKKNDGSLLVVPGSHKSNYELDFKKYIAEELPGSIPVEGSAGDVLIFSECLIHMGNKKITDGDRINLYYLYSNKLN